MGNFKPADNVASTSSAVAKKTDPMGGMSSMFSFQQPGREASRAAEEGDKWSPSSSPNKPAAGKTLNQFALFNTVILRQ